MSTFWINALSAHGRFRTSDEVESALEDLVECFRDLFPPIQARTIQVILDESIELRSLLLQSESINKCLNLVSNKDLVREWYLYTKKHMRIATPDLAFFTMRADGDELTGNASSDFIGADRVLGFRGTPACDASVIELESGTAKTTIKSITNRERLWSHLPRYEASPKHRDHEYHDANGELVAPMTLTAEDASLCLLCSLESGNDRFGILRGQFYRFKRTYPGQSVFHGFDVAEDEVPQDIAKILRTRR